MTHLAHLSKVYKNGELNALPLPFPQLRSIETIIVPPITIPIAKVSNQVQATVVHSLHSTQLDSNEMCPHHWASFYIDPYLEAEAEAKANACTNGKSNTCTRTTTEEQAQAGAKAAKWKADKKIAKRATLSVMEQLAEGREKKEKKEKKKKKGVDGDRVEKVL